ncbi:MAG: hypothetical protein ACLVLD_08985 [Hungatella sp.]
MVLKEIAARTVRTVRTAAGRDMEELVPVSRLFCVKGERRFYAKAIRQDGFFCIVDQVHRFVRKI